MWDSFSIIHYYENLINGKIKSTNINHVDMKKICRTCLVESQDTCDLFKHFEVGELNAHKDGSLLNLCDMLRELTGLQVEQSDQFPKQICTQCAQNVSGAYYFKIQSKQAAVTLRSLLRVMPAHDEQQNYEEITPHNNTKVDQFRSFLCEESDSNSNILNFCESEGNIIDLSIDSVQQNIEYLVEDLEDDGVAVESEPRIDEQESLEIESSSCYIVIKDESEIEMIGEVIDTTKDENRSEGSTFDKTSSQKDDTIQRRKNTCVQCDLAFLYKRELLAHIRKIHPNEAKFQCPICGAICSHAQSLNRHINIHNDAAKDKSCSYCAKKFARMDDLKRHLRIHTNERPYKCSQCNKSYKQTSELKEHVRTHSSEKSFKCTACSKILSTRYGFYLHMKVHRGIKPFNCEDCGKRYGTNGELVSHRRHIHKNGICKT